MRNIYNNFIGLLLLISAMTMTSCNSFFDEVPTDDMLTIEKILETRDGALTYLASIYTYIPDEFRLRNPGEGHTSQGTSGAWIAGCDEAEFVWNNISTQNINNGTYNPAGNLPKIYWDKYYMGIRTATLFIRDLHLCDQLIEGDYAQWMAEAKAVRAIYYYYLFRLYGPVPIILEPLSENASIAELSIPRNSVEEVVNYITTQLEEAQREGLIENIKTSSSITSMYNGLGHIDQAIAQAFIVQIKMLAASDLFNGSNQYFANLANVDGKKLFPSYDTDKKRELWASAAKSAKDFIVKYVGNGYDLCRIKTKGGVLDPYLSYRESIRGSRSEFTNMNAGSSLEMIFFNQKVNAASKQYEVTPKHSTSKVSGVKASGGMAASQEIVDSYFMANGIKPITGYEADQKTPIVNSASGYSDSGFSTKDYKDPITGRVFAPKGVSNAWVGREPRFYADITFDGQKWLFDNIYTKTQYSGNSGKGTGNANDYTKTGYVVRKSAPLNAWNKGDRNCILMRLAQIYLDYAEALNESDPGNADILVYINLIRERAGIPQYGSSELAIPSDMRQAIRDERRIELAFESYRYFDVRRWCIAEQTEGKPIHGMNIEKNGKDFFVRTKVEDRVFEKKHYFFPIPQNDITINTNLVQNVGWY